MATEVLRPQDCLIRPQRRSIPNSRINRRQKAVGRSDMRSTDRRALKSKVLGGDVYAGSGFLSTSPPPASSLPLPSFSSRKMVVVVDDSATRDLRRLLRLE